MEQNPENTAQDAENTGNRRKSTRNAIGGIDVGNIIEGESMRKRKRVEFPDEAKRTTPTPSEDPQEVNSKGQKLWNILSTARSQDHVLSTDFMELPSKRLYPDYYKTIKKPISFAQIKEKLDKNEYTSFNAIKEDFNQMFVNAKRYNVRDSPIFQDAKKLHKILRTRYPVLEKANSSEIQEKLDQDFQERKKAATFKGWLQSKLQDILDWSDPFGRKYSEFFMALPARDEFPDYYQVIQKPMAFEIIQSKLTKRAYITVQQFMNDINAVFLNAQYYNEENSRIWLDAKTLESRFHDIMKEEPPVLTAAMRRAQAAKEAAAGNPQPGMKLKLKLAGQHEEPKHDDEDQALQYDDEYEDDDDEYDDNEHEMYQDQSLNLGPGRQHHHQQSPQVQSPLINQGNTASPSPRLQHQQQQQTPSAVNNGLNTSTSIPNTSTPVQQNTSMSRPPYSAASSYQGSPMSSRHLSQQQQHQQQQQQQTPSAPPQQINYMDRILSKVVTDPNDTILSSIRLKLHPSGFVYDLPMKTARQHALTIERKTESFEIIPVMSRHSKFQNGELGQIQQQHQPAPPCRVFTKPNSVIAKEFNPPDSSLPPWTQIRSYAVRPQLGLNTIELKVGLSQTSDWKEIYRLFVYI